MEHGVSGYFRNAPDDALECFMGTLVEGVAGAEEQLGGQIDRPAESEWKGQLISHLLQPPTSDGAPTICRLPAALFRISPDQFRPTVLHLGLLNRKAYSEESEELKVRLARGLLPQRDPQKQVEEWNKQVEEEWNELARKVVRNPKVARRQYERRSGGAEENCLDVAKLDDDTVASMLALDAICVVAFLQVSLQKCSIPMWTDVFREHPWWGLLNQMETEMMMMQNQVPMSCLKAAVQAVKGSQIPRAPIETGEELERLLRHAVIRVYPLEHQGKLEEFMRTTFRNETALVKCNHILDCLYRVLTENLSNFSSEETSADGTQDDSGTAPNEEQQQQQQGPEIEMRETLIPSGHRAEDGTHTKTNESQQQPVAEIVESEPQVPVMLADNLKAWGKKIWFGLCRLSEIIFTEWRSRNSEFPQQQQQGTDIGESEPQLPVLPADKLKMWGINIRSKSCRLSEIKFKERCLCNAELLLPQLEVTDSTAGELRNLAVYEHLQYPFRGHVRKYLRFMNDLVSDTADANILIRSRAIISYVGGVNDIMSIWEGLNRGLPLPYSCGADGEVSVAAAEKGIRRHSKNRRRKCCADIRTAVFGRPTLFFSALTAGFLFLFAIVQLTLTIMKFKK